MIDVTLEDIIEGNHSEPYDKNIINEKILDDCLSLAKKYLRNYEALVEEYKESGKEYNDELRKSYNYLIKTVIKELPIKYGDNKKEYSLDLTSYDYYALSKCLSELRSARWGDKGYNSGSIDEVPAEVWQILVKEIIEGRERIACVEKETKRIEKIENQKAKELAVVESNFGKFKTTVEISKSKDIQTRDKTSEELAWEMVERLAILNKTETSPVSIEFARNVVSMRRVYQRAIEESLEREERQLAKEEAKQIGKTKLSQTFGIIKKALTSMGARKSKEQGSDKVQESVLSINALSALSKTITFLGANKASVNQEEINNLQSVYEGIAEQIQPVEMSGDMEVLVEQLCNQIKHNNPKLSIEELRSVIGQLYMPNYKLKTQENISKEMVDIINNLCAKNEYQQVGFVGTDGNVGIRHVFKQESVQSMYNECVNYYMSLQQMRAKSEKINQTLEEKSEQLKNNHTVR